MTKIYDRTELGCPTFQEVEGYLRYYAARFKSNRFDYWELINEAWLKIKDQPNPKYWSAGIRWVMRNYTHLQIRRDTRGNLDVSVTSLDAEYNGNEDNTLMNNISDESMSSSEIALIENKEQISKLVEKAGLEFKDVLLIFQYYYQESTLRELAKRYDCSFQTIYNKLQAIQKKLKRVA